MKRITFIICLTLSFTVVFAQKNKKAAPDEPEAPVNGGRIVTFIGYKDNHPAFAEKSFLPGILFNAVTVGFDGQIITAYNDSSLKEVIIPDSIMKFGERKEVIQIPFDANDPESEFYDSLILVKFNPKSISWIVLLEDSFYFAAKDSFAKKIIGIGVLDQDFAQGFVINSKPIFWVKYDDALPVLRKFPFLSAANASGALKFSDYFERRMFKGSYPNSKVNLGK